MLVASERFGDIDIDASRIIDFPEGVLGFPSSRRYALIDSHDTGTYFWLQSLDDPALAFLSVVPWAFFPDYEPELNPAEQEALGLESPEDAIVLCLLTVHRDQGLITANLLGPIIVNTRTQVGRQVVLADSGYPVRAPLGA